MPLKVFALPTTLSLLMLVSCAHPPTALNSKMPPLESTIAKKQNASWAASWWQMRHNKKLEQAKNSKVDILLLGDSLTHGWEDAGREEIWQQYYPLLTHFNIGFSGDRTEHVLWRLQHGAVDNIQAKVTVLLIGTNNTGHRMDPAQHTALGVKAIINELRVRMPQTKILLLAIFPRERSPFNDMRKRNEDINQLISALSDEESIFYLDISQQFLNNKKYLTSDVMPDLLHPNNRGYQVWAKSMRTQLLRLLN